MAIVTILAALPSIRLGLADMLSNHGHTVLTEEEATDATVWVLDAPSAVAMDTLAAHRYSDSPRAAVVLSDDPSQPVQLARAGLRGWACLARDVDADAIRAAVSRGVLLVLNTDAHAHDQIGGLMRYAVGTARRGGAGPDAILNTRDYESLRRWLAR